jgi:ribosomal protein S24E
VRKELVEKLKADEKLTIVDSILPEYGRHKATGYVKVYDNADAIKVESSQKIKKNLEGKKKKKPGEAVAEAPAAKPADAKKEGK